MLFNVQFENVDIKKVKNEYKIPLFLLIKKANNHCEKLRSDYKLNSLRVKITTEIDEEVGGEFKYGKIDDKNFIVFVTIQKQINSLLDLYYFAHEVGHFIKGHRDYFLQGKEKPSRDPSDVESEADEWAKQFFKDMDLAITKEIEEAIQNSLSKHSKPDE